jgi:hypothetical protein
MVTAHGLITARAGQNALNYHFEFQFIRRSHPSL